jgi:hypothetical protein
VAPVARSDGKTGLSSNVLNGAGDRGFILGGYFGKPASRQQYFSDTGGIQGLALSHHDKAVGIADIQLVAFPESRLLTNGFRDDHLALD